MTSKTSTISNTRRHLWQCASYLFKFYGIMTMFCSVKKEETCNSKVIIEICKFQNQQPSNSDAEFRMQRQLKNHEVKLRDLQNGKNVLVLCYKIKLNTFHNFELTFSYWLINRQIMTDYFYSFYFPLLTALEQIRSKEKYQFRQIWQSKQNIMQHRLTGSPGDLTVF